MTEGIKSVLDKNPDINKIIAEEVRPEGRGYGVGNLQTHRALMWLQASIAIMIYDNYPKIKTDYIYPSSWRAAIGIKTRPRHKKSNVKTTRYCFCKR